MQTIQLDNRRPNQGNLLTNRLQLLEHLVEGNGWHREQLRRGFSDTLRPFLIMIFLTYTFRIRPAQTSRSNRPNEHRLCSAQVLHEAKNSNDNNLFRPIMNLLNDVWKGLYVEFFFLNSKTIIKIESCMSGRIPGLDRTYL